MDLEDVRKDINQIVLTNSVRDKQNIVVTYIPELKSMMGFEHKHPHHHLDVWNHTLVVLDNLSDSNMLDLKMAGLLHDIGKPFSYKEEEVRHFHGHPEVSAKMCKEILERLGYDENFISNVYYLVRKHDTPIDIDNLDNNDEMIRKLLKLQYADAKAHHPDKITKRIEFLDNIREQFEEKVKVKEDEERI